MFSLLYLGLKLFSEKGAENRAQYEIDKKYRELSEMDMWDAMEKQLRDNIANNSVYKDHVRWKCDRNGKLVPTSFRDINLNKEFRASGMTKEEFAIQYYIKQYENRETLYGFRLYNNDGSYTKFNGRTTDHSLSMREYDSLVIEAGESEHYLRTIKEIRLSELNRISLEEREKRRADNKAKK